MDGYTFWFLYFAFAIFDVLRSRLLLTKNIYDCWHLKVDALPIPLPLPLPMPIFGMRKINKINKNTINNNNNKNYACGLHKIKMSKHSKRHKMFGPPSTHLMISYMSYALCLVSCVMLSAFSFQ